MSTPLGSARYRLAHRISTRHASTDEPVAVEAALRPVPFGWSLRYRDGEVLIVARQGGPAPTVPPTVELRATGTRWLGLLADPSASLPLTAAHLIHRFDPIPAELVVDLVRQSDHGPRIGAVVRVRATGGPTPYAILTLPESSPGRYTRSAVVWTADFTPFDVLVDGHQLTSSAMDFTRPRTRIRLIDTT